MKKLSKAWGKELGKVTVLPQPKTVQVLLHTKTSTLPTRYAPSGLHFTTYILTKRAYPQYQQP